MMTPQLRLAAITTTVAPISTPERKILTMRDDDEKRDLEQDEAGDADQADETEEVLEQRPPQRSGKGGG